MTELYMRGQQALAAARLHCGRALHGFHRAPVDIAAIPNPSIPSSHKKPSDRAAINASIVRLAIFPFAIFRQQPPASNDHREITRAEIAAKGRKPYRT